MTEPTPPAEPSRKMWMQALAEVWALVPDDEQPALEPLQDTAIVWGHGLLPTWPFSGWLVEEPEQADALKARFRPQQPDVIVLARLETYATLGDDATSFPLLALAGEQLGWVRGFTHAQFGRRVLEQTTERVAFSAQIGMLLTAMSVGLYRKIPQFCTAEELAVAYQEGRRVTAGVLKALDRQGVPTPEDFGPPVAPPSAPPAPSAATAPLHLAADCAPDPAPVIEHRPFGFHSAAQARRDADKAWDRYWHQPPRYL